MMAFGGDTIDKHGVVRDFPGRSMLTGLIANALGYDRAEADRLDRLQDRIRHAAARRRESARRQDYQTARLFEKDAGWTTAGGTEGRAPSPSFDWDAEWMASRNLRAKSLTHQRLRDFDADAAIVVALTLDPADETPDMAQVEHAIDRPERPLFIGRKPFLPSRPLREPARIAADTPLKALVAFLLRDPTTGPIRVQWDPVAEDAPGATRPIGDHGALHIARRLRLSDIRRHRAGVHSGTREVAEGAFVRNPAEAST